MIYLYAEDILLNLHPLHYINFYCYADLFTARHPSLAFLSFPLFCLEHQATIVAVVLALA